MNLMSISYEPLWQMLYELDVSKMEFARAIHISNATLAKLGKNEPIALTVIDRICNEFECRIEDVVQHIPDILLSQKQSDLPINEGSIVEINCPIESSLETHKETIHIQQCVVIKIHETTIDKWKAYQYSVAPISSTPTHYLSMFFENVPINGKLHHGWISLEKMHRMSPKYFVKITGKMPKNITKKIEKFLHSVDELFDDERE